MLAHQAIVEFVAAASRPARGKAGGKGNPSLLTLPDALAEAEALMSQFDVLYPSRDVLVTAMRGVAAHGLPWFVAQIWATAEVRGLSEILSADLQHGRHYGRVRAVNPFLAGARVAGVVRAGCSEVQALQTPGYPKPASAAASGVGPTVWSVLVQDLSLEADQPGQFEESQAERHREGE